MPCRPISAICCQVAWLKPRGSSVAARTARGVLSRERNSRVRSRSITCSCVKSKSMRSALSGGGAVCSHFAWQLQDALADDVLLNFAGPGVDGTRARPEEIVGPRRVVAAQRAGVQCKLLWQSTFDLTVRPENVLHQFLVAFVELAVVQLVD